MITIDRPRANLQLSEAARTAPASTVDAAANLLRAVNRHKDRAPFVEHVLDALASVTAEAEEIEPPASKYDALIQLLEQPEILAELRKCDPLAPARVRGMRVRKRLLEAEGGTCTAEQMAQLLDMTRQGVDKRRKRGTLIALNLGKRGYAYPTWQVGLDGLDAVLTELQDFDPWTQVAYMLTPNALLDGDTPLDLLRLGEIDRVVGAASCYGDQIAK